MSLYLVYEPLDANRQDIRLVKLFPSRCHSNPLVCDLVTSPLLPGLDFQSLSYAWGQDKADVSLSIGIGYLLVTSNLSNALRAVRRADRAILLWVDAICINQQDVEERNHQVQLMRQIYTTAATVNVWLGSEVAGTGEALSVLEQLATGRPLGRILLEQANTPAAIRSLTTLFMYPWWQRLWVIQEALLANHALVFCGSHRINFQTILQAFEMLWNEYIHTGQQLRVLCGVHSIESLIRRLELTVRRFRIVRGLVFVDSPGRPRRFRNDPKGWPFLLRTCSWSNVTDPRDKVYGTLGLFPSAVLEPDYSLDVTSTYTRSTFHIIERMGNLALVSQAVSRVSLDNGLPSWVPDWRVPSNVGSPFLSFYNHFGAGRSKALKIELLDERLLKVNAALIDEIMEVGVQYNHQECTHAADLPSMLKPTMENWIKFLRVPNLTAASFTDQFTELSAHPSASPFHSPNAAVHSVQRQHSTQRSQANFIPKSVPTSMTQSLSEAPHQPSLSSHTGLDFQSIAQQRSGQKRRSTWNDSRTYQTGQPQAQQMIPQAQQMMSTRAPLYRDQDYAQSIAMKRLRGRGSNGATADKVYDAFTHTYIGPAEAAAYGQNGEPAAVYTACDAGERYITGAPSSEVFWRTLCMDVVDCQHIGTHRRCIGSDSHRFWEWLDWVLQLRQAEGIPQLHWHLNIHLQGKCMIRTKLGHVGLASKDVAVGDKIYIFAGESYPYVARPVPGQPGEQDLLHLVSPSYVHGLMDGNPPTSGRDVWSFEIVVIA
ncbi:hypothetical protein LTR37_000658 [Vermiconidia calcicola]|uniref:Uncharacterized protein n=1 Tax=Vermiconidia calcicola TaxID=1690605 RepID=A0ACC3NYT0_9PEZI|nr:hypothetical protein LTR37_000658 [Vermiconidia calcicola]